MNRQNTTELDDILDEVKALLDESPCKKVEEFDWASQSFYAADIGPVPEPARPESRPLAADRQEVPMQKVEKPVKKRKKWPFVLLALLLAAALGVYFLLARQPIGDGKNLGARKAGVSTILLAGTDADGGRTDTIMLMQLDSVKGQVNLVSIPRDTLVNGNYSVPKINSAYGRGGREKAGMEELMTRVTEILGFSPDGYALVDLAGFIELVDLMGGVDFHVPVNMNYSDPTQDLYIDLKAGQQTLNGQQAMGLVRFRSGYAQADLQRVNVQRDFVMAAASQWASLSNLGKIPALLGWYGNNVTTDLSVGNLTWLGLGLLRADLGAVQTETMPGTARMIAGGSYYCLDVAAVTDTVNQLLNPYKQDVVAADLNIRVG